MRTIFFALGLVLLAAVSFSALVSGGGKTASAASLVTAVVVDIPASSQSKENADAAKSALGMLAALKTNPMLAIVTFSDEAELTGPLAFGTPELRTATEKVYAKIDLPSTGEASNLPRGLAETYNLLSSQGAQPGSSIYLISGGAASPAYGEQESQARGILVSFKEKGWQVNTIALAGSDAEVKGFLESAARATGGTAYEVSLPNGLKFLADRLLQDSGQGSLASFGQGDLGASQIVSSSLGLAPRTREATLLLLREAPSSVVRLLDPSGAEMSASSPGVIQMVETPLAVIWRLQDPKPGEWQARMEGREGKVFAWNHSVNLIRPYLESPGPFPLDEPTIVTASIRDGDARLTLDNVKVFAQATSASGSRTAYELNDRGIEGDRLAGDGYYSVRIPPVAEQGLYQVNLELAWPDYKGSVSSQSQFKVEPFPRATIERLTAQELEKGKPTRIALITVHVQGKPFPVTMDQLAASVTLSDGTTVPAELSPQQLFGEGRSWGYYATVTPQQSGQYSLNARLNVNYLGREYIYFAQPIFFSVPVPPPAPVVVEPAGFPSWAIGPMAVAAVILLLAIFWLLRPSPFGYLYDDKGNPVVDFGQVTRPLLAKLLFKSSIRGSDLGVPGLEGVSFRFHWGKGVTMSFVKHASNVRVNNQPATGNMPITDRSWIGAQGKLYLFSTSSPSEPAKVAEEERSSAPAPERP